MKDYTDSMLQSMSNGVITLDPRERGGHLQRLGRADLVVRAGRAWSARRSRTLIGEDSKWLMGEVEKVVSTRVSGNLPRCRADARGDRGNRSTSRSCRF